MDERPMLPSDSIVGARGRPACAGGELADGVRNSIRRAIRPVRPVVKAGVRRYTTLTAGVRLLPDFVLIGTQRGGTTSLYNYLVAHPGIAGAVMEKEVHFFDENYSKGEAWYRARFPSSLGVARRPGSGRRLIGEASPYYLFHPHAASRLARMLPEARLIAMLRDPVERAYSHYRHEVDLGHETLPFEEAIEREPERLRGEAERMLEDPTYASFEHKHHSYLARGIYADQLPAWNERFPEEELLVLRSEDFFTDPAGELRRVLEFLGVRAWRPARFRRYNAATSSGMSEATRRDLLAFFRPHNARLRTQLGRDFGWDTAA